MEKIHENQRVIDLRDDQQAAVANAGYALHRLITFFKEDSSNPGNLHYNLFGMLAASVSERSTFATMIATPDGGYLLGGSSTSATLYRNRNFVSNISYICSGII